MRMTGLSMLAFGADPNLKLFQDPLGRVGVIVLVVVVVGMLVWFGGGLFAMYRRRRAERLPAVFGDPQDMLDRVCVLAGLGVSDRYLLNKTARRMNLPQPAAILLSPVLLRRAADTWIRAHRFAPTQNWGLHRLDLIARTLFGKPLRELES